MSIEKLWPFIQEIEDLYEFFPTLKPKKFPEREFMWEIISTLRPTETKKLIDEARQQRSIKGEEDPNQLVEVDPGIFKEIQSVLSQKGK